jgi:enterochelin esterase family protein
MAETPNTDIYYRLAPDALPQDGVPKGEIRGPFTLPSQAYPGTQHTYWIYVPAQYDPATPASLMIYNDGQAFMAPEGDIRAQVVMDNLIYRREIPVMIGVFINPGRRPDQPEPIPSNWGDRDTNRPTEYNTLDDKYARVIVDELLPVLYKDYNISKDPERHGIGGSSSGAIAAFTVAWERPDQFRKVLSNVGSFTNIRGGKAYPDIIRKSEKKPLRVFLVDGRNDNRGLRADGSYDQTRDWFYQNVRMQQALTEKGYEINYSWGIQPCSRRCCAGYGETTAFRRRCTIWSSVLSMRQREKNRIRTTLAQPNPSSIRRFEHLARQYSNKGTSTSVLTWEIIGH